MWDATKVRTILFADDGIIPNNPDLPVVILPGALPPDLDAAEIGRIHRRHGWGGGWVYTVFDYHHWHPDAHEALSVASGWAELRLGGPDGESVRVAAGDSLILPAGTGHCRLVASPDFQVCGCYPPGQANYSTRRGIPQARGDGPARIAEVPLPASDPVFGDKGPLLEIWGQGGRSANRAQHPMP